VRSSGERKKKKTGTKKGGIALTMTSSSFLKNETLPPFSPFLLHPHDARPEESHARRQIINSKDSQKFHLFRAKEINNR